MCLDSKMLCQKVNRLYSIILQELSMNKKYSTFMNFSHIVLSKINGLNKFFVSKS
jgi:hypothetical protein